MDGDGGSYELCIKVEPEKQQKLETVMLPYRKLKIHQVPL